MFIRQSLAGLVVLVVYVHDILLTENDKNGICIVREYLQQQFAIKDLGQSKYFLGIEFAFSKKGVCFSRENMH